MRILFLFLFKHLKVHIIYFNNEKKNYYEYFNVIKVKSTSGVFFLLK